MRDAESLTKAGMPRWPVLATRPAHDTVLVLAVCGAVAVGVRELVWYGPAWRRWDMLLVSGAGTLVVGLWLVQRLLPRMRQTLVRLVDYGTLDATEERLAALLQYLDRKADRWAGRTAVITAVFIALAFVVAYGSRLASMDVIILAVLETVGGYVAGCYLGRLMCYGTLGRRLQEARIEWRVTAGHPDSAGGLKPIGDFYFHQAAVAGIPAIFLAAWLWLIPAWPRYDHWRSPYLALLLFLAIPIEVLAFLCPLWSFHRGMVRKKAAHLEMLSAKIATIRARSKLDSDAADPRRELAELTKQYWDVEHMPTWPMDRTTLRRFSINNLALAFTPTVELLGGTEVWRKSLARLLGQLLQGD